MGSHFTVPGLASSQPLFLLFAVTAARAIAEHPDSSEAVVSWHPTPANRGSLQLLYSCLLTIFTCTWTVLHLNVPGRDDSMWTRIVTKAKWMAITVLLPEFIFSKAVCDLRHAWHDLSEFESMIQEKYNDGFKEVVDNSAKGEKIVRYWKWHAEYGRVVRFLYRLMALGQPPTPPAEEDIGVRTEEVDDEEGSGRQSTSQHRRLRPSPSPPIEMDEPGSLHMRGALAVQNDVTGVGEKTTATDIGLSVLDVVGNPSAMMEDRPQQDKALSNAVRNKDDQTTHTGGMRLRVRLRMMNVMLVAVTKG